MRVATSMGSIIASLLGSRIADSYLATGNGDITVLIPSNVGVTIQAQNSMADTLRRIVSDYSGDSAAPPGHARGRGGRGERRRTAVADLGHGRNDFYQKAIEVQAMRIHLAIGTAVLAATPGCARRLRAGHHGAPACGVAGRRPRNAPYLGIGVKDIDSESAKKLNLKEVRGVEITQVEENSPAAKAGIKEGDVVLEYNGQPVEGGEQLSRLVRETPIGRQVKVGVWRNGSMQTLTATRRGAQRSMIIANGGGPFAMPRRFTSGAAPAACSMPEDGDARLRDDVPAARCSGSSASRSVRRSNWRSSSA